MPRNPITADTTINDILSDPAKYGAPTYMDYISNPGRWSTDNLALVDQSTQQLRQVLKSQVYTVFGVKCKTLERAESIAQEHGHKLRDMVPQPQVIPVGGGYCEINVVFAPKGTQTDGSHKFRD